MKKLFFAIAALAVMTGCNNDELVEVTPKQAIAFGNAFVDNATRAIDNTLNTDNLESFKVYGSVTGTTGNVVNIYDGIDVKKQKSGETLTNKVQATTNDKTWYYDSQYTQYWVKDNRYEFAAIVNGTVKDFSQDANQKNNMPKTISYDADTQKDLLYASAVVNKATTDQGVVAFSFDHLLSKVQFTFTNTIETNQKKSDTASEIKYTYKVYSVDILNAYREGTYNISEKKWTVSEVNKKRDRVRFGHITDVDNNSASKDEVAIEVGDYEKAASATSHNSMLLIPNNYTDLKIGCDIELLLNGQVIGKERLELEGVKVNLQAGHAYNFIIEKGAPGEVIKFSVQNVNGWSNGNTQDSGDDNDSVNDYVPVQ